MIQRRRALVAQHRMPEFDRERGSLRVLEIIYHLQAYGWDVTYLTVTPPSEQRYVDDLARRGVETLVGVGDEVMATLTRLAPELAIVAFWHVAEELIPLLRAATPSTRIVVDSIDLHFVRNARRLVDGAGESGWLDEETTSALRRELNTYASADAVLTVSDAETATLRTLAGDGLLVRTVPLAERIQRSALPFDDRAGIVFVGNFRHLPNIEAVAYLCQEVLPRLDPRLLAAHPITIVGNDLDDRVRDAARFPGVRLVGWVPDIGPYLGRARVAVAPLLHGAGVKGKVLQALMSGTPTVATSLALEGTELIDGEHVLVGDSPAAFARQLALALTDAGRWTELADAGHEIAWRDHATIAARQACRTAIADVLAAPSRTALASGSRRWTRRYDSVRQQVAEAIGAVVPHGAQVAVISGGDAVLVEGLGRDAQHFPADADGLHSFHPVDGAAAVSMLHAQRARGVTHMVLPSTAYWWLHQYPELALELATRWTLVAELDDVRVWCAGRAEPADADILVVADAAESDRHRIAVVADLPDTDLGRFERVVLARGRRLTARWLDAFLEQQHALQLDVAQAAADVESIGRPGLPPAAVRHSGVMARRTRAVTTDLPVTLSSRALGLVRGDSVGGLCFGVLDACAVPGPPQAAGGLWLSEPFLDTTAAWSLIDISTNGITWQGVARPATSPRVSVVIATYDRAALLEQCLSSLVDQTLPADEWEVVVVDDGSSDATPDAVRRWSNALPLRWLRIAHSGRSVAKNLGILAAAGDLVLMLDDDDVASPDLLLEHVKAHDDDSDENVAVLGYTELADGVADSPLMRFVTEGATMLFAYHELNDGDRVDWRYFWEGRLSCKRALLVNHGLHDPRLAYTIDIELGYRLAQGPGLTVVHRRTAVSWMARPVTYADFLARMSAKGAAQHRFATLHPTPEIRAYCHVDVAERDWNAAAPTFERDQARIAELEPLVASQPELLGELHELYARTLRAANRRAVLEAAQAQGTAPLLSIVIPVWSVTPELAEMASRTVDRIWEVAQLPTEVIVVDNGSPHKRALAATDVIEHEHNTGVAPAWNDGIRRARADTIVVLNSDVLVEPGWDVALHAAANDGRRIAFPYTDHADGLGPRRSDQAGTAGWCFALSRAVIDEIGPFDESFRPAFFEDADYWTRAHELGVELNPVPASVVRHARRSTARHHPEMQTLFQAHRMKYSWKHGIDPTAPPPYWHRPIVEYA